MYCLDAPVGSFRSFQVSKSLQPSEVEIRLHALIRTWARKWAWPFRIFCKGWKLCTSTKIVHKNVFYHNQLRTALALEVHTQLLPATTEKQAIGEIS